MEALRDDEEADEELLEEEGEDEAEDVSDTVDCSLPGQRLAVQSWRLNRDLRDSQREDMLRTLWVAEEQKQ